MVLVAKQGNVLGKLAGVFGLRARAWHGPGRRQVQDTYGLYIVISPSNQIGAVRAAFFAAAGSAVLEGIPSTRVVLPASGFGFHGRGYGVTPGGTSESQQQRSDLFMCHDKAILGQKYRPPRVYV